MYGVKHAYRLTGRAAFGMLLSGLALAVLVGVFEYRQWPGIAWLDRFFLDSFVTFTASEQPARSTVVVDIDELSLSAVGQWPWPRYRMGALLQAIAAAKPASIGIDVLFSEPDRASLINVRQAFKRDFGVDLAFTGVPAGLQDNDGYFGHVMAQTDAVGAKYFYFDHSTPSETSPVPTLQVGGRTDLLSLAEATGVLINTQKIVSQTRSSGFINNRIDDDGRLRYLPLLIRHNGVVHAHLALVTTMKALNITSASVEWDRSGPYIQAGSHRIPIDENGYAVLRFNGKPGLYPSVSAMSILNGSFSEADIRGKIVFIGSSAAGLSDLHNTVFDSRFPGLKIQAVTAENIVTDQLVRVPDWAGVAILIECMVSGALMALLYIKVGGASRMLFGSIAVGAIPLLISASLFGSEAMFFSPGAPLIVTAVLFAAFSVTRFAIGQRQATVWAKRLENARQVTMESMAAVAETRDPETGAHIKRTQYYVKTIAEQLQRMGQYRDILTREYIDLLFISAPLHDIGKVGVPDEILLKPGKLTDEEFVLMKRHAEYGKSILVNSSRLIEGDDFLIIAGEIAATHHEKWDGTGYPLGLKGQDIPLSGRIMAVADIYDALISRRCYKEPFPHQTATAMMRKLDGRTFDPVVLEAFFHAEHTVLEIAAKYAD